MTAVEGAAISFCRELIFNLKRLAASGQNHCNIVQSAKTNYLFEKVTPAKRRFRLMNGQWMALQDGTEAIEKMLKLSMALLERREAARAERKWQPFGHGGGAGASRTSGTSRTQEAAANAREAGSGSVVMPQYYREFEDLYRQLYWCYDCCNYHGWNGALPPVAFILNRSTRPSHVAGYAQPHATAVNGMPYHAISLTLNIVGMANSASMIPVLLHEMTHIWQF